MLPWTGADAPPAHATGPDGRVTVAVITRDRRASALRTLDALRALPERPPVIVVDSGTRAEPPRRTGHSSVACCVQVQAYCSQSATVSAPRPPQTRRVALGAEA